MIFELETPPGLYIVYYPADTRECCLPALQLHRARQEAQNRADQFGSAVVVGIGPENGFEEVVKKRT